MNLRNLDRFLFSDEEMNPRQNADRDEVVNTFGPIADSIVAKILEAGDCYLTIAEQHPVARQEHTFPSSTPFSNLESVACVTPISLDKSL